MSFQFVNLRIHKIIAHEIFHRNEDREIVAPKYSNDFTKLDQNGLIVLQERIINVLGNESYSIEMTIDQYDTNSTFDICMRLLDFNDEHFKELSRELPNKLAQAQTSRKIPGGVVVAFKGLIGQSNHRFIGIIKAEVHSGFSIIEKGDKLLLNFLSDLLLTPQQKLYKIAIFIEKKYKGNSKILNTPDNFKVFIFDHNMTRLETQQAAQYFYETFLGCSFSPSNKKLTSDFYHKTKEYIDSLTLEEEKKIDLNTGLYTYLKVSQKSIVEVVEFAEEYVEEKNRDEYMHFMYDQGIPTHAIKKDLTYLKYKLKRRNLKFTSNVKIIAPSEQFDDLVNIKGHSCPK
jgi:hypothetical protein